MALEEAHRLNQEAAVAAAIQVQELVATEDKKEFEEEIVSEKEDAVNELVPETSKGCQLTLFYTFKVYHVNIFCCFKRLLL